MPTTLLVRVPVVTGGVDDAGVTEFDDADAGPVPAPLVAVTVNRYEVPLVRPATITEVAEAPAATVAPPGETVTVYPVIGDPPSDAGGLHWTVADPLPAVAVPMVGAPGTAAVGVAPRITEAPVLPSPTASHVAGAAHDTPRMY